MPLADAFAINFSAPLFAALASAVFLKERVGAVRWVALGIGFLGVLVVTGPGSGSFQLGALFALGNAVLYGTVTAAVRGMTATESTETLTMYQMVVLTLFFALLLPLGWWHFLRKGRTIDRVRVGFLGVKPEFQHTGVAAKMYVEHFDMAVITPQKWGEMGWILETNTNMNRAMEAMGGRIVRRYRVYERELGTTPLPTAPSKH